MIKLILVVGLLLFWQIAISQPQDKIRIATYKIPKAVISANEGVFIELFMEVARRQKLDLSFQLFPTRRAISMFTNSEVQALMPVTERMFSGDDAYPFQRSVAIVQKKDFLFYRSDEVFDSLKSLRGKSVGLAAGTPFPVEKLRKHNIRYHVTGSTLQNLKMLALKRISAYIADARTVVPLLEKHDLKTISYNENKPIHLQDGFLAFQNTLEGKNLAKKISVGIKSMKRDGTFQQIMAKFASK